MNTQMKAIQDALLTGVSSAYMPKGLVADKIFPTIKSKQFSGKLAKYGKSHLRIVNSVTGGKGKYRRVDAITTSTDTFYIEGHGLEGMVSAEDYANRSDPYDAEKDETNALTSMLALEKEYALAAQLTNAAIVLQNVTLAGGDQFSDYTNSNPLDVFRTLRSTILKNSGGMANAAIMDAQVADALRYHPAILDALGFKFSRAGELTESELARALNVKKLFISEARYNAGKEGAAENLTAIWGRDIVFLNVPDSAEPYQISAGYQIRLEGSEPRKVYKTDVFNPPGSKLVLVEDHYDMVLSDLTSIYLVKDAIAAV